MAQNVPQTRKNNDAQSFPYGVNSYVDPQVLKAGQVQWAENAVNKGGVWQTRPGFKTRLNLTAFLNDINSAFYRWWYFRFSNTIGAPEDLFPQGFKLFTPLNSDTTYLIFCISGSVWKSEIDYNGNFGAPVWISELTFDATVRDIHITETIQSAIIVNGSTTPITPKKVLIFQDGLTRAGFFDGMSAGHLNPEKKITVTPDGDTIYESGYNGTPIGTFMAWSGNRLWVVVDNTVRASDLNNPLEFTEELTLTSIPVFVFPQGCTGIIDRGTSGVQESLVFVFTQSSTYVLRSGIQNRIPYVGDALTPATRGWVDYADFQRRIFANVGCISHRSAINHAGILHWYSEDGIVSFDSTGTVNSSQYLPPMDDELAFSKLLIAGDGQRICAMGKDSYVGWSVPGGQVINRDLNDGKLVYGDGRIYNNKTQVYDKSVIPIGGSQGVEAWQGVWTGIQPVQWETAEVSGQSRTIAMSMDHDGQIRFWEAFQGNRCDNGMPIDWMVVTKAEAVSPSPFLNRKLLYFQAKLVNLYGKFEVQGYWKGLAGKFHKLLDTSFYATPGRLLPNSPIDNQPFTSYEQQVRSRVISENNRGTPDDCSSGGVEQPYPDEISSAFSLMFKFRGVGGFQAYRIATDEFVDNTEGLVMDPETGDRIFPEDACPTLNSEAVAPPAGDQQLWDDIPSKATFPYTPDFEETGYVSPTVV